jgi:uncharacterized protein YndB with AHSA1/START domain
MSTFDPGPPADATVHPTGGRTTLVFVRDLRHPPGKVWAALTDPGRLDQWAPFTADRPLDTVGGATLTMIDGDIRMDLPVTVRRAQEPTLLEYSWGDDLLRWELEGTEAGTRLTLRHMVADPAMIAMVAAGWQICIAVAERLLDGDPVGVIRGRDAMNHGFEKLRDAFAEKFGIAGP